MPRTYLPLLPLPVLAVIVAVAACSKPHSGDTVAHVIPPASSYLAAAVEPGPKPEGSSPLAAAPAASEEQAPSADEVKAFERVVAK